MRGLTPVVSLLLRRFSPASDWLSQVTWANDSSPLRLPASHRGQRCDGKRCCHGDQTKQGSTRTWGFPEGRPVLFHLLWRKYFWTKEEMVKRKEILREKTRPLHKIHRNTLTYTAKDGYTPPVVITLFLFLKCPFIQTMDHKAYGSHLSLSTIRTFKERCLFRVFTSTPKTQWLRH